ncbi:binding-protein-dependent transport system inner membrane component [Prosthecobacter fusiformis]|uniref:Binding-protein-dependent transport system inner membrane component n=1 Tax=Prosthecobacter fusiformis TaxID=48464 RepID=A0A4R7S700_9BACT|nr:phosphate ABC transporter permease PstA [Prosthecobacter fusiformis]TDU72987.1 binding-protein-dependent transport system inner membrane component [Prosthecobacter fusiformis]
MPEATPKLPARTKGEVKVWLTAAGLTIGLIMISGLLLLIAMNGLSVFWPDRVAVFTIREGDKETRIAGSLVKTQQRRKPDGSFATEHQIFTGNKDAYNLAFRFINAEDILSQSDAKGIYVAERMEYGDAVFTPVELQLADGTKVAGSAANFASEFSRLIQDGNDRRAEILKIEKHQIGDINARMKRLEIRSRTEDVKAEIAEEQALYQTLADKAQKLRTAQTADKLVYQLASGEERTQNVGDILHFYLPNDIGIFGRTGVFLHAIREFLLAEPREANTEGGIFPAIFGTFVMTLLMAVMVTPFGIIAAIYLREYARQGLMVQIVRICVNNLAGVPSIVFGVFGLGFFVYGVGGFIDGGVQYPMAPSWWFAAGFGAIACIGIAVYLSTHNRTAIPTQQKRQRLLHKVEGLLWITSVFLVIVTVARCPYFHGFFSDSLPSPTFGTGGILWASLTLALMTLPVVIVATEEALVAVPRGVREAALACGASKWQTIQRIVLPSALPGVMTGVILAMARGAGEVAPLMITGVVKLAPSLPLDLSWPFIHAERKFMHLGFHIFDLGFQSPDSEGAKPMVFATTLLLILLVVALNLAAIQIRARLRKKYQASAF